MAPIRVLWLIKGLGPGGAEQLLLSSAEVADHSAFDYDVAYVRPDKDQLVQPLRDLDVDVYRLGDSGRWLTDLRGDWGTTTSSMCTPLSWPELSGCW